MHHQTATGADLGRVRERRGELRHALERLESALAAPVSGRGRPWAAEVGGRVRELKSTLVDHIAGAEGPGGLFEEVLHDAPRLARRIERLRADHDVLRSEVDGLLDDLRAAHTEDDADRVRERAVALLGAFSHHRHLGADLVYEAYATDIEAGD